MANVKISVALFWEMVFSLTVSTTLANKQNQNHQMKTLSAAAKYALGLTATMSIGQAATAACAMFGGTPSVVANELDNHHSNPPAQSSVSPWASPIKRQDPAKAEEQAEKCRAANAARKAAKAA